jgi:hypothetical protein
VKKRIVRLVGVTVVGLGVLTTACGSDDSTSNGSEVTVEETTTTASEPEVTTEQPATTTSESTATTEPPAATAGSEVTIDVLEEEDPGGFGPFTASGVAVEGGHYLSLGASTDH